MSEQDLKSQKPEQHPPGLQSPTPVTPTHQEPGHGPPGGFDATLLPHRSPGYTVKFTVHKATHLPLADLASLSSDPYVKLELRTDLPTRHKEDPPLTFRTRTVWRSTEPEFNQSWIVANVPATGFRLKARVYDEDSSDKDDRLGNAHITISHVGESWQGFQNRPCKIMKRAGSWRAYALRGVAVCTRRTHGLNGYLYISAECLGGSPGVEGGRAYTTGLQYWCKNYSPLLGRIAGSREPNHPDHHQQSDQGQEMGEGNNFRTSTDERHKDSDKPMDKRQPQRYNFQSNQMQLQGPVPPELYHRYVEFRPFVKSMFIGSGLRGIILNKALHAQHTKVYNFNKNTTYGVFESPCNDMTLKFLELAHWDYGGRIHTYIITLDGLMRFTETGNEFSIDLLSKHTMHSDGSIYIAFSGEFFVRRLKNRWMSAPESSEPTEGNASTQTNPSHPPDVVQGGPPKQDAPQDPSFYELIIDNDSGTYRPNGSLLPVLRQFLEHNFPGLKIVTLDSQKDAEFMGKLKNEQREIKKREGDHMIYTQASRSSSLSSSDNERLDQVANEQSEESSSRPKHQLGEAMGEFTLSGPYQECVLTTVIRSSCHWTRICEEASREVANSLVYIVITRTRWYCTSHCDGLAITLRIQFYCGPSLIPHAIM